MKKIIKIVRGNKEKEKYKLRERTSYSKFDCSAGTFLKISVNTVTSPNAPAANHSGTAGNKKM